MWKTPSSSSSAAYPPDSPRPPRQTRATQDISRPVVFSLKTPIFRTRVTPCTKMLHLPYQINAKNGGIFITIAQKCVYKNPSKAVSPSATRCAQPSRSQAKSNDSLHRSVNTQTPGPTWMPDLKNETIPFESAGQAAGPGALPPVPATDSPALTRS
jgi:hypothetical protein